MRETHFRAWDTYNRVWADEYLSITEDGHVVEIKNDGMTCHWKDRFIIEFGTGFKDKNGKEICEGDIVRYNIWLWGSAKKISCTTVVKLWSGEEEEYPYCTTSGFSLPHGEDGYEVIGNIHDNPELLLESTNVD